MKILNKRKGFALTEVLMAIAVIIIVGIAAYPLYSSARSKAQVESYTTTLVSLNDYIVKEFTGQTDVSALSSGAFQSQLLTDFSNSTGIPISNAGSTTYQVSPFMTSEYPKSYDIVVYQVPNNDCVALLQSAAPLFDTVLVDYLGGTAVVKDNLGLGFGGTSGVVQMTPTTIAAACQGATLGNPSYIFGNESF
jgi:Tfp pilus assembly protein PilE